MCVCPNFTVLQEKMICSNCAGRSAFPLDLSEARLHILDLDSASYHRSAFSVTVWNFT